MQPKRARGKSSRHHCTPAAGRTRNRRPRDRHPLNQTARQRASPLLPEPLTTIRHGNPSTPHAPLVSKIEHSAPQTSWQFLRTAQIRSTALNLQIANASDRLDQEFESLTSGHGFPTFLCDTGRHDRPPAGPSSATTVSTPTSARHVAHTSSERFAILPPTRCRSGPQAMVIGATRRRSRQGIVNGRLADAGATRALSLARPVWSTCNRRVSRILRMDGIL